MKTSELARPAFVLLANDAGFLECRTLREQVLHAKSCFAAQQFSLFPVTNAEITHFLCLNNDSIVSDIVRRGDNGHMFKGRIGALDEDDIEAVRQWIDEAVESENPLTLSDVVVKLSLERGKNVTKNALRKVLTKSETAKTIVANPEEASRMRMNHVAVDNYMTTTPTLINNVHAAFVFNMDESGINEYANAKAKKVLVGFNSGLTSIRYPVRRDTSHATLVACIASDGTSTKPLVIIKELTIRERLVREGWTRRKVMFAHTTTGYINQDVFLDWVVGVFVPEVERRRVELEMPEQQAFLVMDNCTAHTDPPVLRILAEHGVVPVFIPPHGSHVFQPLDRVAFASFKRNLRSAVPEQADKQTTRLLTILESWEKVVMNKTIMGSFKLAGFRYETHDQDLFISFDPQSLVLPTGVHLPNGDEPQPEPVQPRTPSGHRIRI